MTSTPVDLSGKRLFIAGGTGFVGKTVLDYLAESATAHGCDFSVTVLTRSSGKFLQSHPEYEGLPWLGFVDGDLATLATLELGQFTDVIHAAADTHKHASPLAWYDQLVGGTRAVLEFARRSQARRFLFVSSGAVYAPVGDGRSIGEDEPGAPQPLDLQAVYGNGKRAAETLGALYQTEYGIQFVTARCFAIVSRHIPLDGPYALGNFVRDAIDPAKAAIEIQGDGLDVRSYLDGWDMAHAMLYLLEKGQGGQAYNVGSAVPISIRDLAQQVLDEFAPHKQLIVHGKRFANRKLFYVPDMERLQQLGLRQNITLAKSLNALRLLLQR
nr:NAD(P)-dependent oxidoreductase [Massilia sp. JS1662]